MNDGLRRASLAAIPGMNTFWQNSGASGNYPRGCWVVSLALSQRPTADTRLDWRANGAAHLARSPLDQSVKPDVFIPSAINPMLSIMRIRPSRILNTSLICIALSLLP